MTARTTLHGVDEAVSSANLSKVLARASHGFKIWEETKGKLLVFDDNHRMPFVAGGGNYWSTSSPRLVSDSFEDGTININWTLNKGSDAQAVNFANVAGDPGYVRGVTGDAGTGTAADAVSITGPLSFAPATSEVFFAARVKLSAITTVAFFIGLTDALASTLEMPFTLSTTTFTSNATDAVGFLFDTAATTDTIRCCGVATDVDVAHYDSSLAPVADTYMNFAIKVDANGKAYFYINGTLITSIAACVTPATSLCPIVVGEARTTSTRNVDIDFLACR